MDEKKAIGPLKTLRKIDGLNEGLLTIILAFLIGFVGLLYVLGVGLLLFVAPEATASAVSSFRGDFIFVTECCFNILVLAFVARCLVKPVYLALSKRKRV